MGPGDMCEYVFKGVRNHSPLLWVVVDTCKVREVGREGEGKEGEREKGGRERGRREGEREKGGSQRKARWSKMM